MLAKVELEAFSMQRGSRLRAAEKPISNEASSVCLSLLFNIPTGANSQYGVTGADAPTVG